MIKEQPQPACTKFCSRNFLENPCSSHKHTFQKYQLEDISATYDGDSNADCKDWNDKIENTMLQLKKQNSELLKQNILGSASGGQGFGKNGYLKNSSSVESMGLTSFHHEIYQQSSHNGNKSN